MNQEYTFELLGQWDLADVALVLDFGYYGPVAYRFSWWFYFDELDMRVALQEGFVV